MRVPALNRRFVAIPILLLVGLAVWAFWWEPAGLGLERRVLSLSDWPPACSGFKVALVADLHVGSPFNGTQNLERVVEMVRAAEPDLILLLGDYVIQGVLGGRFVSPEASAKVLGGLDAPAGVFAVLGNHDWWLDGPRVREALQGPGGIAVLEDSAAKLTGNPCGLWVAGVSDYWERDHDIARALARVPEHAPVIAFTHNPDIFPDVPTRVTLTVAGHTHGGQVRFPLIGAPVVPSDFGDRYASGYVSEGGRDLYVNTGIGTSILPVRFGVPPVVTLLTLQTNSAQPSP